MTFTSTFSFAPDSVSVKGQKVEVLDLNMRLRDCYNFHDFRRLASTTLAEFSRAQDSQITFSVTHGWSAFGGADHGWQDVGLER
jgi:hypothetical protein